MACYDRQSEWCMRTHHTCHLTVPFPALSPIPTPLLHTPTSHPHTSTPSTTPDSFWPAFATIAAHTFLSRMHFLCLKALAPSMNNTLATNTRANGTLSHEPKTHSPPPPPPSLPSRQAAHAIQSSPPALSPPPPPPTASASPSYAPPRTGPGQSHTKQSGAPFCSCRPTRERDTNTAAFPLRALQVAFGNILALRTLK